MTFWGYILDLLKSLIPIFVVWYLGKVTINNYQREKDRRLIVVNYIEAIREIEKELFEFFMNTHDLVLEGKRDLFESVVLISEANILSKMSSLYSSILLDVDPKKAGNFSEFEKLLFVFTDTLEGIQNLELKEGIVHGAHNFNDLVSETFKLLIRLKLAMKKMI